METVPQDASCATARRVKRCRWFGASAPLFALLVLAGCVHDQLMPWGQIPAPGKVAQLVTTWNREVAHCPDIMNAGNSAPGIVGRLYCFGDNVGCTVVGDGSLTVILYDDSDVGHGGESRQLESGI